MKYLSKDLIFTHVIIIYKGYYYVDIHQKRIRKRLVIVLKIAKSKTMIQYIHRGEVMELFPTHPLNRLDYNDHNFSLII